MTITNFITAVECYSGLQKRVRVTTRSTCVPDCTLVPPEGDWLVTLPHERRVLTVETLPTVNPALVMLAIAVLYESPTTFGTMTSAEPINWFALGQFAAV